MASAVMVTTLVPTMTPAAMTGCMNDTIVEPMTA
jgi:hypothetical protein